MFDLARRHPYIAYQNIGERERIDGERERPARIARRKEDAPSSERVRGACALRASEGDGHTFAGIGVAPDVSPWSPSLNHPCDPR